MTNVKNLPRLCQEDTNLCFWIHALSAELLKLFRLLSFFTIFTIQDPRLCQDCVFDWDPLCHYEAEKRKAAEGG